VVFGAGLLALAVHLAGIAGFSRAARTAEPDKPLLIHQGDKIVVPPGSPLRDRLRIAPAASEPINPKLVLPGIVEADPARTASVLTPLGGRLVELKVSLGDQVAKGKVVAVIDSPDLAQAFDDDEKAKDALDLADKNLVRQEGQVKIGAASPRDLDQARSDRAQAEFEYRRTQARLKIISAAGDVQSGKSVLALKAPVGGSVTSLSVAPGSMINDPTQPIMTITDLSTVWVTALVPETEVASIAKDQDAEVVLAAYPRQVLHGKVLFVSDVIEPDSRRDKLRIAFLNPSHALKPNMFATVTLLRAAQSRVVLPTSALLMNNDRTTVFVATAPWTFERRTVVPQLQEGSSVAIESGLSAGDQVVVAGGILLND
jgi:membrane fusion protein, heavy metal efflux system